MANDGVLTCQMHWVGGALQHSAYVTSNSNECNVCSLRVCIRDHPLLAALGKT